MQNSLVNPTVMNLSNADRTIPNRVPTRCCIFSITVRVAKFDAKMGNVKSSLHVWISCVEHLKCRGGIIGRLDAVVERVYPVRGVRARSAGSSFLFFRVSVMSLKL